MIQGSPQFLVVVRPLVGWNVAVDEIRVLHLTCVQAFHLLVVIQIVDSVEYLGRVIDRFRSLLLPPSAKTKLFVIPS